jgi:prepilin peptidase CpaA
MAGSGRLLPAIFESIGRSRTLLDWQTVLILQKGIAFAAVALLAIAAYSDIKTFRIPNTLVLAIAALGVAHLLLADLISAIYAVGAVVLIFVIGFLLFSRGVIGAGDVKLLMATILLIRYRDFYEFFMLMAGFGGLLALVAISLRILPLLLGFIPVLAGLASFAGHIPTIRAVPYGVAISSAGIVTLLLQPMLFRYSLPLGLSFLW